MHEPVFVLPSYSNPEPSTPRPSTPRPLDFKVDKLYDGAFDMNTRKEVFLYGFSHKARARALPPPSPPLLPILLAPLPPASLPKGGQQP